MDSQSDNLLLRQMDNYPMDNHNRAQDQQAALVNCSQHLDKAVPTVTSTRAVALLACSPTVATSPIFPRMVGPVQASALLARLMAQTELELLVRKA
jgi:hypothetical protein